MPDFKSLASTSGPCRPPVPKKLFAVHAQESYNKTELAAHGIAVPNATAGEGAVGGRGKEGVGGERGEDGGIRFGCCDKGWGGGGGGDVP